jgi:hypothetical protein
MFSIMNKSFGFTVYSVLTQLPSLHHALAIDVTKAKPAYLPACPNDSAAAKGGASFSPFLGGAVDEFTQLYTTPDGKFNSGYYINNHSRYTYVEALDWC